MMTIFLLNQESLNLMHSGMSHLDLKHELGPCRFTDQLVPEAAVAYREEYIKAICRKEGLALTERIRYGSWCGRTRATSVIGQDIVVTRKVANDDYGPASGLDTAHASARL